jgi:hypothetical protein
MGAAYFWPLPPKWARKMCHLTSSHTSARIFVYYNSKNVEWSFVKFDLDEFCLVPIQDGTLTIVDFSRPSDLGIMRWEYLDQYMYSRPPLWSSGHSSWLQNGDVLCFLWGTNWIYVCYVKKVDRLCGLVGRVLGSRTEMYCASCEVRTEFIYVM